MSMDQLMALVPIEAANTVTEKGRKSRWEKTKERKGSRWGDEDDKPFLPSPYVDLPPGLTPAQMNQFLREQRYDDLSQKMANGELELGDPDIRPPSPPPIYDKNGSRINTRDVRVKSQMTAEYHRLIEFLVKAVEGFIPPADYRPVKKMRRIEIPLEKYPEYNFMGLIIGPRGCNHKRLEAESGAQISIRGKGTQKEGKKTDHQTDEEASMPMHVHIASDSEEKLEKAVSLIEPLLDPFHPMHEEFKKRGLEQLALVNGLSITKADQRCAVCGATGHLAWECPDAQELQSFKKPDVRCAICGDMGHVTMDCKFSKQGTEGTADSAPTAAPGAPGAPPPPPPPPPSVPPPPLVSMNPQQKFYEKLKMDQEYMKMMNELTGEPSSSLDEPDDLPSSGPLLSTPAPGPRPPGSVSSHNISTPPPGMTPPTPNAIPSSSEFAGLPQPHFAAGMIPGNLPPPPPPPPSNLGGWDNTPNRVGPRRGPWENEDGGDIMGRAGWDDGPNAMGGARRGGWGDERDANVGGGCMGSDNWRGPGRGGPNGGMYSGGPTGGAWGNYNRVGLGHPERGRGGIRGGRENWGRGMGWSPRGNRSQPPPPPAAPGMPIFPDPNAWGPIAPPPSIAAQFQRHVVQQQPQPNVHLMNSKGQGVVQNPATSAPMPSDSAPPLPSDAPPLPPDGDGSNGTGMDQSQMSQQMAAWQMSMMGGMWEPNAMIMAAMMGGGVPPQGDHMDMQAQQIAAMQMAMAGGMMPQMGGAPPAAQPGEDSMDTSN